MIRVASIVIALTVTGCPSADDPAVEDAESPADADAAEGPAWAADVTVAPASVTTAAGTWPSSTRLRVSWREPSATVDHYRVTAIESVAKSGVTGEVPGGAVAVTLSALKSDTQYAIEVLACGDPDCGLWLLPDDGLAFGSTARETWRVYGETDGVAGAHHVVADGNVKVHAIAVGDGAPIELQGRIQLYYGATGPENKGVAVATSVGVADGSVESVADFSSLAGSAGLLKPPNPATLVAGIATSQAVPLSAAMGGKVRLFFEARGADQATRIMSIDSVDALVGQDFHPGPATTCQATGDYESGGPCEPTVAVGVEGDTPGRNPKISNARQFKIGFPTLSDWRWTGTPGTFMFLTVGQIPGCSTVKRNNAYAVWNGLSWEVEYDDAGCPKLFEDMQAPAPLHLGEQRYKLYFGRPSLDTARPPGSTLPFLGPKKVVYADGAAGGTIGRVDFQDWEPVKAARDVDFVWPSGKLLTDAEEGLLDDFVMLTPTGETDFQVMYTGMTDGKQLPFIAVCVLLNP